MATKMTFRHIGYYNDYEDVKHLFGCTANYVVQTMLDGLGAFHSVTGESETDIDDYKLESDADKFVKTTNGNFLVRFERGSDDGEGWFIDIYKLMEVEDEDTIDEDDKVYEYCPYCENDVVLENELKVQICPDCGHAIVPCNICPLDNCCSKCPLDELCRQKNEEMEMFETTLSGFIDKFESESQVNQGFGYNIFVQATEMDKDRVLLFFYDFNNGLYSLMDVHNGGKAYTWVNKPTPGELFDGLWNVTGDEMETILVKANF
jgi:hypothetical protein